MESFFLFALICAFLIRWLLVHKKFRRLEEDVARLRRRVWELEQQPHKPPREAAVATAEVPQPIVKPADAVQPATSQMAAEAWKPLPFATKSSPPRPNFRDRLRTHLGEQEWEALVGGSLLNKIGALVLVIGIALFLGYSFAHMNAAGRALTCVALSWSLIGGGVLLERRQQYNVLARGLIGAGWAALYVTAYAIYAIPAARLIDNPFIGSVLLLIVAVGMIGHSLFYRRQAVTAIAYFAAFAALSVTPWSSFGFVALAPLAASLLYLAARLNWSAMATFGVVATYGSCIWRGDSGASLLAAEGLLLVFWLLFEGFDLLRVRKHKSGAGLEFVFPVNAAAFLGLAYRAWLIRDPAQIWLGCAYAAVLFLASAVARWRLRAEHRALDLNGLHRRMHEGSFEAPITVSAVLAGVAIIFRATGVWLSAGLAIEAELLYLAGVALQVATLRALARMAFSASVGRLLLDNIPRSEVLPGSMKGLHPWTPVALFHAFLFYANRALRTPNVMFSSIAAALIGGVLILELPGRYMGMAWLIFALLLLEIGLRKIRSEFRFQAYALALGGTALNIAFEVLHRWQYPWMTLGVALAIVYGLVLRLRAGPILSEPEKRCFDVIVAGVIAMLSILLVWHVSPHHYRGLSLCGLSVLMLEMGSKRLPSALVYFAYLTAAVAATTVVHEQAPEFVKTPYAHVWITYLGASAFLLFFSERARLLTAKVAASSVSIAFVLAMLWLVVPDRFVPAAWAGVPLALFVFGLRKRRAVERLQSYAVAIVTLIGAVALDLPWASVLLSAVCYFAEFSCSEKADVEPHARTFWSVLGTITLTALLWEKFPGGLLTTAWGLEGIALLVAGFILAERICRLQGLAMLLLCILKLFLYDLRNLEIAYRILSFIALGVILLAVSYIYSRFRNQIRRHL